MALSADEQNELASLQSDPQATGAAPSRGLSASEQAEMHQLSADPDANPTPSLASRAFSAAGTALDYPRSAVVSPTLDRINSAMTGAPVTSQYGASGNPRAAEIMAKDGVPKGKSLSDVAPVLFAPPGSTANEPWYMPTKYAAEKGGIFDVSPRGVAGGAIDMATDPLTYVSAGVNKLVEAAKAGGEALSPSLKALSAIFNPASNTVEGAGKATYASGMSKQVQKGMQYGKDVADTLYEQGLYGSPARVARVGDEAAERLKATRDATMADAQKAIDSKAVETTPIQPKTAPWEGAGEKTPLTIAAQDNIGVAPEAAQPDLFGGTVEAKTVPGERPRYSGGRGYSKEAADPLEELKQKLVFSKAGGSPEVLPASLEGNKAVLNSSGSPENFPGEHEQLSLPTPQGFEQAGPVQVTNPASPSAARAYQPLVDHINGLVADKRITPEQGQNLLDGFAHKTSGQAPSLQQLSQWKTDASNAAGNAAYDVTKNPSMAKRMSQIEAGGNRDELTRAANNALPGSGDSINETNKDLGNLLTVQGVNDAQAARAGNARLITPNAGNHVLTTGLITRNPVTAALHAAGSTALKAFNDRTVRNSLGYLARKVGTNAVTAPVIDAATFNAIKNMANPQPVAGVGK